MNLHQALEMENEKRQKRNEPLAKRIKALPQKPSALIRLAVRDLKAVAKRKGYIVDMSLWHTPTYIWVPGRKDRRVCGVCFAGAVMANSCKLPKTMHFSSYPDFPDGMRPFFALDDFRCGDVGSGVRMLGFRLPRGLKDHRDVTQYQDDPKAFFKQMLQLAADLKEHDL